jgi:hypothetical protein
MAIMGAMREIGCKGTDYKKEESPPFRAIYRGHIHSGGEVAHSLTCKIKGTRK